MKATLRKQLRTARRSMPAAAHALRSRLATAALTRLATFRSGARIAIYLPFDGETDTAALVLAARRRGVHLFVPVVSDRRHGRLSFQALKRRTRRGAFGISIPHRSGAVVPPRWFNLIVVPLVGVTGDGCRLGMGGGFYDRALAFRRLRHRWKGPHLAGLAFECQYTDTVFADPWDIRLDSLATESGLRFFLEGI